MDLVRRTLFAVFMLPVILSLAIVLLYESDLLAEGSMMGNAVLEYQIVGVMEIITICLIPPALRLFKFKTLHRRVVNKAGRGMIKWGAFRIAMIGFPMIINTFLYYQYINVAFGYMAIIGLLSLVFVYPSETRCRQEMGGES